MTAPSRTRAARKPRPATDEQRPTAKRRTAKDHRGDPDGGTGVLHQLLTAAVAETARLLDADGAMVYLVDPTTGNLRFAHDAGIKKARTREWIRSIELAPGVGMFGRAVADRAVVTTSDYSADTSFRHAASADRVVDDLGIKSMVVAPLAAGDEVFGALGTFSKREDAFDAAHIALVRSLAEHAASAMANARLIEELDRSRQELDRSRSHLARRADAERSLRQIAARINALREPDEVLQDVVDEARRLLRADGAVIDQYDAERGTLLWAYDAGLPEAQREALKLNSLRLGKGVAGKPSPSGGPSTSAITARPSSSMTT